jgi:hypothetical protein
VNRIMVWLDFRSVFLDNIWGLGSIFLFTVLLHVFFLKFSRSFQARLIKGGVLVLIGLLLFLQGVNIGLAPAGMALAEHLGSDEALRWMLIPLTFFFGYFLTKAEPAVNILCSQVEEATAGSVPTRILARGISLGVGVFAALGIARVLLGLPLMYILVPGYLVVLLMIMRCAPLFIGVAFDACTVTTGPMIITFVMSLSIGLATVMDGRDPLLDGFGLIALVALAPIVSILLVGILYRMKSQIGEK